MSVGQRTAVPFRRSLQTKVMAGVFAGLAALIGLVLLIFYWRGYELLMAREQAQATSATQRLGEEVRQQLTLAEGVAASLANLGERLPKDETLWRELIPHVLDLEQRADLIAGGGLWPEPFAWSEQVERRSFFWGRNSDGQLEFFDEYNDPSGPGYHREEWYVPARHQAPGRCYWSRSYRDPYTNEPMVTCTVAMRDGDRFIGVSTVDLRLAGLQHYVSERGQALSGYAMVVDRNGVFITLPPAFGGQAQLERLGESMSVERLAAEIPQFGPLAQFLSATEARTSVGLSGVAEQISAAAAQIDLAEAERIIAQLADTETNLPTVRQQVLESDPFLGEPVLVTVLSFPGVHWQLTVVQPSRLVHEAVLSVLTPVVWPLALSIVVVVVLAAAVARQTLVKPITRMAAQLRESDESPTPGRVEVPGSDELGLLANTFNLYAERLAQSHEKLRASADQFRSVTALAHDALIQVDDNGSIISVNPAGERTFGLSAGNLQGRPLTELMSGDPRSDDLSTSVGATEARKTRSAARVREMTARRANGESFPAEVSVSYWRGEKGGVYNIQVRDVTERRRAEEQVRRLATHDTLTGLPNRVLFQDRLQQAIQQSGRTGRMLALLFLDLDHFKLANDSLGHAVGDTLLKAVAERLLACVGAEGSVARLGGDEFAILLPTQVEASEAAEMANRIIAALEPAFNLDGHLLQVGVSIGVTLCPNDGRDADQLLRKADLAMYDAKAQGRNTYRFFTESLRTELLARSAMLQDLKQAALADQLMLHYQPIVSTRSGRVLAVEALLRWQHPQRGLVGPDEFVPLAERTGLIVPIGQWVIDRALAEIGVLSGQDGMLRLAINLSLAQFADPGLVDWLASCLRKHGVEPERLELELTETALLHDLEHGLKTMEGLRSLGVSLVIDDFGIGYSSLAYLKRFPVEKLKIDRSFILGVAEDAESATICRAVIGMGRNLGLLLVAEGVENQADLEFLCEQGVDYVQGYYYTPALPAGELRKWMDAYFCEPREVAVPESADS